MTPKVYGALGVISPRPFASHQRAQDPVPGKSPISETPFRKTKTVSPPSLARRRNQSPPNSKTSRCMSVEHAKKQAQAQILMVVTLAEALDSEGKKSERSNALAKAKLLLNP